MNQVSSQNFQPVENKREYLLSAAKNVACSTSTFVSNNVL